MEEIDIIELLKRVKEGKAPKRIEVRRLQYEYSIYKVPDRCWYYREIEDDKKGSLSLDFTLYDLLDMKIKILDKPIIEELRGEYDVSKLADMHKLIIDIGSKINEIIKHINKEEK